MGLQTLSNMVGFGKNTLGGNQPGAVEVPIDTLADNTSPGSLRYFLDEMGNTPRYADVQVSGIVELNDQIFVGGNLSLIMEGSGHKLGVSQARLRFTESQVIMQGLHNYCTNNITGKNLDSVADCYSIGAQPNRVHDIYFRDMMAHFAVDENQSIWGENYNITLENCGTANALDDAGHSKGRHGMGLLVGFNDNGTAPYNVTVIGCFFGNNDQRNPLAKDKLNRFEFINNVIYNAGRAGITLKECQGHIYGNVLKRGPSSGSIERMFQTDGNSFSRYHILDNFQMLPNGTFIPLQPSSTSRVVNQPVFTPSITEYIEDPAEVVQAMYDNVTGTDDDKIWLAIKQFQLGQGTLIDDEDEFGEPVQNAGTPNQTGGFGLDYIRTGDPHGNVVAPVDPDPDTLTFTKEPPTVEPFFIALPPGDWKIRGAAENDLKGRGLFSELSATVTVGATTTTAIAAAVAASTSPSFFAATDNAANMFQDAARTVSAANGDPVGGISAAEGSIDLEQPTSALRPTYNAAAGLLSSIATPDTYVEVNGLTLGSDMYFACVVDGFSTGSLFALGTNVGGSYAGWASGSTSTASDAGVGSPTYRVDGTVLTGPVTQKVFRDAIRDGGRHVVEIWGLDLSAVTDLTLLKRRPATTNFAGLSGDYTLFDTPAAADRDAIGAELRTKHGI